MGEMVHRQRLHRVNTLRGSFDCVLDRFDLYQREGHPRLGKLRFDVPFQQLPWITCNPGLNIQVKLIAKGSNRPHHQ
jgi:hypothetical protein